MEAKLYVGNLPYSTVDADLQTLFAAAGTVKSAQVIKDRQSGRSKGFGFVVMEEEGASKAIATLNGSQLNGRTLTVNEAKPMVRRDFGGGDRRGARRDRY